ncbi:VCBS repeat-containing protein [Nodularia harveyana UHCC-0300]|uniref:VCBS repeat-containing protein n=1 Tax=Nodularia harveyana UHCC-0300 TaxID=2974287 RepID=A0ABU5U8H2_9CYAN|nr:VCBS repeat-containing protein [Nodularia harveyana]MEA5579835.1 VCBS repeat-containing protein [Nodularia harveyana UHCC-0300]
MSHFDLNGTISKALDTYYVPFPAINIAEVIGSDINFETGEWIAVGDRDVDFFKINSPRAGILELDIISYADLSIIYPVDAMLFLYNSTGDLLAFNDDRELSLDISLDPFLRYQINANTDYFVAVAGYDNSLFNPVEIGSGSSGDVGEYRFNSRLLPVRQIPDFNGDGQTDILLNNPSQGWNTAWLMNETTYTGFSNLFGSAGYQPVATADFNADGKTDLIVSNPNNNFNAVWFLDGPDYLNGVGLPTATGWEIKGAADFNGDGNVDILLNNTTTNWNTVWFLGGDNGATYTGYGNLPVADGWNITGVADFNGDGQADILLNNPTEGWNAVWFLDDTDYIGYANLPSAPGWQSLGTGDFNGDGRTDIIMNNISEGWNSIWFMDGTNYTGFANLPNTPAGWEIAGMA